MLQLLQQWNVLHTNSITILYNTDRCAEQYICATVLYLLPMLSHEHDIIVDRVVGSPGHVKDVVDVINATENFIYQC